MDNPYLDLGPVLLCGSFVAIVSAVLTLPGALVSHGSAGGNKVNTAGSSSLHLVIIPITLPVVSAANHPLDPVVKQSNGKGLSGPCRQPSKEQKC